jgi:hypothetical protein
VIAAADTLRPKPTAPHRGGFSMATKRTFAAWAAIVLLSIDITAEVARLGVCIVKPNPGDAALCADPIGPVSRMVAQMFRLLSEAPPPEPPPVVVPPPTPPPVAPVSPLDRIKAAETL